ncbi:MAG TPA: hypothetical protein VFD36_10010 [Kofleriaceae bacterium]|nr:hypothetical protein [Kofleriaceae bacterium]
MTSRSRPACVIALLLGALGAPARADIAIESYVDRRPLEAERATLERLKAALERQEVATRPAQVLERAGAYLPLSGYPDRSVTRTNLIAQIDKAMARAAHEAYDEAVAILETVFRDLDANPALGASDRDSQSWITKGRVALAFACARSKKSKQANDVIVDHIRSYPEASLQGEQEEVERLYAANTATIARWPRGKLIVRVNRPDAEIFVNAAAKGKGSVELSLLPGDYRIVVRQQVVYRSYKATVRAGETEERTIDWAADAAFTVAPDWVGFAGLGNAEQGATAFVQQLTQRLPGEAVIVIGIVRSNGRRYVVANRYRAAPAQVRPGRAIDADGASDAQVEALAAYVTAPDREVTKTPSGALLAVPRDVSPPVVTAVAPPAVARPARWPVLAAVGVFSVALPLGAYQLKLRRNEARGSEPAAVALLGIGSAAFGFGLYWILRGDREADASSTVAGVQLLPGGGVAQVSASF